VKKLLAILFGALLVLTQTVNPNGVLPEAAATNCGCGKHNCGCGKHCCCAGKSAPDSAPLPAAPTRSLSPGQWQMVLAPAVAILNSPVAPVSEVFPVCRLPLKSDAIPLYQWNCAYVI
jgi:hypothetical protein